MHPALSVIVFTTTSGAGYGLLAWLGLAHASSLLAVDGPLGWIALALSFVLITAGLLTSTFHLGHPERAWRALSQWRSSWLSREGVLAVVTYAPMVALAAAWWTRDSSGWSVAAGYLAALLAIATVASTAMIYASLPTIPQWATGWTLPVYLTLAAMTGALWLAVLVHFFAAPSVLVYDIAMATVIAAGLAKLAYWRAIDRRPATSDRASATGLGDLGTVRVLEQPTTSQTFVMREMGFQVARKHSDRLRKVTLVVGFLLPLIALAAALAADHALLGGGLIVLAAIAGSLGTFTERWLFFAEAKHVSMLYH